MNEPLAARLRPRTLSEYQGQQHLVGPEGPLYQCLRDNTPQSMILWGPPGVGKTTLARLWSQAMGLEFVAMSAVLAGVKDIREAVKLAQENRTAGRQTLLFVDEVHRFNKSQQDAFLPFVEEGVITFIGATTENPGFYVNNALLSRVQLYPLYPLNETDIEAILTKALDDEICGFGGRGLKFASDALQLLIKMVQGDARRALNALEAIVISMAPAETTISVAAVECYLQTMIRPFDHGGDIFYHQISALHKSVRGSDPDAALYWFTRMLDGGCDPLYIGRRVIRMASEDIGNADPRALEVSVNAINAFERLGSPEGELALAQAVLYLASAPKSNAVYAAYKQANQVVKSSPGHAVPPHLCNAPTRADREKGLGADYHYAHDFPDAFVPGESYLPAELSGQIYYEPTMRGLEKKIHEKLAALRALNKQARWKRYE